ncbi:HipB Predicted transcriptional regulators [uncultured Caudovirales phage]|uniref:HipB Predicted transcriptional regulators n=1 Tax=uncultured Caudovirales phage TaxID=2100421 RepID=A0A6J5TEP4_9CAUD|nr:HipB Predicted transcriptional regulators [uncultured Caudovirales phage]
MNRISERLKLLRQQRGLSQADVADAIGISRNHIWALENGITKNPSVGILESISNRFCVSMAWLFGETEVDDTAQLLLRQLANMSTEDQQFIHGMIGLMRELTNANSAK